MKDRLRSYTDSTVNRACQFGCPADASATKGPQGGRCCPQCRTDDKEAQTKRTAHCLTQVRRGLHITDHLKGNMTERRMIGLRANFLDPESLIVSYHYHWSQLSCLLMPGLPESCDHRSDSANLSGLRTMFSMQPFTSSSSRPST